MQLAEISFPIYGAKINLKVPQFLQIKDISLWKASPRMADVDGASQGQQKNPRTKAGEINPVNFNVPSIYTDAANVNNEDPISLPTNNNDIPGFGIPLVSKPKDDIMEEHGNSYHVDDTDDVSTNLVDFQTKSPLKPLVGNTENYSGSKHSHIK
jgi:hypothetical protein